MVRDINTFVRRTVQNKIMQITF